MNKTLRLALNKLSRLQIKHSRFGAFDTEPDTVFQVYLSKAVSGLPNPYKSPEEALAGLDEKECGLQMFDSMPGCAEAKQKLAAAAWAAFEAIKCASETDKGEVVEKLWRINWAESSAN